MAMPSRISVHALALDLMSSTSFRPAESALIRPTQEYTVTRGSWRPTLWNLSSFCMGITSLYSLVTRALVVGIPIRHRTTSTVQSLPLFPWPYRWSWSADSVGAGGNLFRGEC